jgi:signal transduction histidine kinase/DNA-binding NarL/FixJ family response regulator
MYENGTRAAGRDPSGRTEPTAPATSAPQDDDTPLFAPDGHDETSRACDSAAPWLILVVDDDPQVHAMTRVLLRDYTFEGRRFEVVSACSARDAHSILAECPDIPVALLDVVMETDDSGLVLVRRIREELGNRRIRIILRTGQPGEAPERDVVVDYDINDYKSKTELTSQKLFTAIVGALRSWRDIVAIERHRLGLERILNASAPLFEKRSMRALIEGIVTQLHHVLDSAGGSVLACRDSDRAGKRQTTVVAGSGRFAGLVGQPVASCLPGELSARLEETFRTQNSRYGHDRCILAFRTLEHGTTAFLLERPDPFTTDDHRLLELFCSRVAVGFDNVCLYEDLTALTDTLEQRVAARTAEIAAKQQALAAAKERIELALERELEATDRQRQFLSMVSHEFRTPLAVIDSAAQMLGLRIDEHDSGMRSRLQSIRTSVRRLNGLIESYLADDRLHAGTLALEARPFDLAGLLASLVENHGVISPDARFTLDLDGLPETVTGDPDLLSLAFNNLLSNAVKYSPADARVEITGRPAPYGLSIAVRDHGIGIPASDLPHVFDRFFRGSNAGGVTGTGIGLHLVRHVVELHGGTVTVESAPRTGTTFTVTLPAAGARP